MTPEEIKAEMLKVKIPWFIGFAEKFWFKAGRYILPIGVLLLVPLFFIYEGISMRYADTMWNCMLGWGAFLMGIGLFMLVAHLIEESFVKKQAKRLGISVYQWNAYAEQLQLKSYKG